MGVHNTLLRDGIMRYFSNDCLRNNLDIGRYRHKGIKQGWLKKNVGFAEWRKKIIWEII